MPVDTVNQQSASSDVEFGDSSASTFGDALSAFADIISSATPLIIAETGAGKANSNLVYDAKSGQWVYGNPNGQYYGQTPTASQPISSQSLITFGLIGLAVYFAVKHL